LPPQEAVTTHPTTDTDNATSEAAAPAPTCRRCGEVLCNADCADAGDSSRLLRKFAVLPKEYDARPLRVQFTFPGRLYPAGEAACHALGLSLGDTASLNAAVLGDGHDPEARYDYFGRIYADALLAETLFDVAAGSTIIARVEDLFALGEGDNDQRKQAVYSGLRLIALLHIQPPPPEK
jgi:hypothetical protein